MNRSSRWTDEREDYERVEPRYPRYEEERYGMQPYGRRSGGERRPDYGERGFERGSYAARYGFQGRAGGPDYGRFTPESSRPGRGREDYDSGYRAFEESHPRYGDEFRDDRSDYEIRRNLASAGRNRWDADADARERDSGRGLEPEAWDGPGRGYAGQGRSQGSSYWSRGPSDEPTRREFDGGSGSGRSFGYAGLGSEGDRSAGTQQRGRTDRGQHAGKGPRGYRRSDDRIQEDVNEALAAHGEIDASDVEVEVRGGEVTLKGEVGSRAEKRCAEDCLERISGVRDVNNQLRLRSRAERGEPSDGQRSANGPQGSKSGATSSQGTAQQKPHGSAGSTQATTSR